MDILEKGGHTYSKDLRLSIGLLLYSIWASEIVCYRIAESMDLLKAKNTFTQRRKQSLNRARRMVLQIIRDMGIAFDDDFALVAQTEKGYMDNVQENANDILKLLLIYFSRGDGDWEKKDKMKLALLNFKPNPEGYNIVELLKYFNLK